MRRLIRVYVGGAYSSGTIIGGFANMRRGIRAVVAVRKAGFAAYNPWADFCEHLQAEFTLEECYDHAMAWLEASDAMLVVPEGAETSQGTHDEIQLAIRLGIPIFAESTVEWSIAKLRKTFMRKCALDSCNHWFVVSAPRLGEGRRGSSAKLFCSDTCRVKHCQRHWRKVDRLLAEGVSVSDISREMGIDENQITARANMAGAEQ